MTTWQRKQDLWRPLASRTSPVEPDSYFPTEFSPRDDTPGFIGKRWWPPRKPSAILRVVAPLSLPIEVQGTVHSDGQHRSGPRIALDGSAIMAGLSVTLSFRRPPSLNRLEKGSLERILTLVPAGQWFAVTSSTAGVPLPPDFRLRLGFQDSDGARLSGSWDVGASGSSGAAFALSFRAPVAVTVEFGVVDTPLDPAGRLAVRGALVFLRGVVARWTFSRGFRPSGGNEPLTGSAESLVVPVGRSVLFPEQVPSAFPDASLLRTLCFQDGYGHPLCHLGADEGRWCGMT